MKVVFAADGWADYQFWIADNRETLIKLNRLIEDARRNLYRGLGKPEPLKGELTGWWSRRITAEHRLVYRITGNPNAGQQIEIIACRHHYGD